MIINLLPEAFINARKHRRRQKIVGALCLTIALGAVALAVRYELRSRRISGQIELARNRVCRDDGRRERLVRLRNDKARIERVLSLREQADLPVQPAGVLAVLASLIPEKIALTRVAIDSPEAPPEMSLDSRPSPKTAPAKPAKPQSPPKGIVVEVSGYAMNDLDAARLASAISQHPLFGTANLMSSRRVEVRGQSRYQFVICAEVQADRHFVVTVDGGEL